LNERSREIFRIVVESYLETGEPVGSRTLAQRGLVQLSPASIRNVMSDLEVAGYLTAPHTSAGRVPTQMGLRLFVDGLMEIGNLGDDDRSRIEGQIAAAGRKVEDVLTEATTLLSGLSQHAGLVVTPKREAPLKQVEFVPLGNNRALVVLIGEDGLVENRVIETPPGLPHSALVEASNYLSARLTGRSLDEARAQISAELADQRAELDNLTAKLIQSGLAEWTGKLPQAQPSLIIRGQSRLLGEMSANEDLERVRQLFDDIERKGDLIELLELAKNGDGVRIFIGAENKLFSLSGSSIVAAPYRDEKQRVVGVIGVIGPTRLNYARIIPMVDYTAKVVGRLIGDGR
ncbi:MAG TPA: heat-inducible transcriptional repressor HrcA, partial [Alphaproteobacteria bacterium]|nr:heat-inducible transcriptional repressor HrcA [Alphaproteobacteria bacterium]